MGYSLTAFNISQPVKFKGRSIILTGECECDDKPDRLTNYLSVVFLVSVRKKKLTKICMVTRRTGGDVNNGSSG
jgi:hypothetical protein